MNRYIVFLALVILIVSFALGGSGIIAADGVEIPPTGFELLTAAYGIEVYEWVDTPDEFVQVIDLGSGAGVVLQHGPIADPGQGQGVYGGDNPLFGRQSLDVIWDESTGALPDVLCVTNGQFFNPEPALNTDLAFPLKVDGEVISEGGDPQYGADRLMLELWSDRLAISPLTADALYSSTAPNIIAGLSENANKSKTDNVERTFVGIADQNGDGRDETLLIYNGTFATQAHAAERLRSFGANEVMMLDGGGSTQLICNGEELISSPRRIPQTLATVPGAAKSVVLIIDSSGSMDWNDPDNMRVQAAQAFIDVTRIGDKIAIIDFDGSATVLAELRRIESEVDRTDLKLASTAVDSFGTTDLNKALNGGFSQLTSDMGLNAKVALLLSDGRQDEPNVPPYDDASHRQYQEAGWPIYTVALGDDVDTELLQRMAESTSGAYVELEDASQMQTIYAEIAAEISGDTLLFETSAVLTTGTQVDFVMNVPPDQTETTFYLGWPGSTASLSITAPDGEVITPASDRADVRHAKGLTYELYVVQRPDPGRWQLHVFGDDLAPEGEVVDVRVFSAGNSLLYLPLVSDVVP